MAQSESMENPQEPISRAGAPVEFYNSVSGAAFSQRLLREWESLGWEVREHSAVDGEGYRAAGGRLRRWRLRWRMYGRHTWRCARTVVQSRRRFPLRVVTTNPFFAPALVQAVSRGRGLTINLLYDLFPDALEQAGLLRCDSWAARRCAALTRYSLAQCAATVFLGERLRQHAEARYGASRRAVVIPVGADGGPFRAFPPQPPRPGEATIILYAGQMGRMHDLNTISRALLEETPLGVRFVFHATGAGYGHLRGALKGRDGSLWGGPLCDDEWTRVMRASPVALVSVAQGCEDVVMPSKTYSALAAGQAILAVVESRSDLAELVRQHDCGWVVPPGDVAGFRAVLREIATSPLEVQRKRANAFEAGHRCYDMRTIAAQWHALFVDLLSTERRARSIVGGI